MSPAAVKPLTISEIAYGLAVLDGRTVTDAEDWRLARIAWPALRHIEPDERDQAIADELLAEILTGTGP